jgi:hypothetical protein
VKERLLELLYSAQNSDYGIVVETSSAELLRQKLYAVRREYEDQFQQLSFIISPINGSDLWVLNKSGQGVEDAD